MVITRKIEIYVYEQDKQLRKDYMQTLRIFRDAVRRAANMVICHKFVQRNIRDFMYLQDDIRERFLMVDGKTGKPDIKFFVSDIIKKGKGMSEQNTTYRLLSEMLKGKMPSDIYSCLNQAVANTFKETYSDVAKGEASLRSYKNNIPIPFSAAAISNIHKAEDGHYYFTWFGIPFACRLGHDRSNNASVINKCLNGEYKLCSSSIAFEKRYDKDRDKKVSKLFLYLCVDIPKKEPELDKKKILNAYLDVDIPIKCFCEVKAKQKIDSGIYCHYIGSAEEFLHRRRQIQEALRRRQMALKYTTGGRGRKKKLKNLQYFTLKEKNYVTTKIHLYSRLLVDYAVKNKCATIFLMNQHQREEEAKALNEKGNPIILRNWSYYSLKEKISYKAKRYGIKVVEETSETDNDDATE